MHDDFSFAGSCVLLLVSFGQSLTSKGDAFGRDHPFGLALPHRTADANNGMIREQLKNTNVLTCAGQSAMTIFENFA